MMRTGVNKAFALTVMTTALGFAGYATAQQPAAPAAAPAAAAGVRSLKMQSSWPASWTLQDNFRLFADRMDKLSAGTIKIEALAAGQVVPPFEVLDATAKKVIDGAHTVAYYAIGKHRATTLFASTPAGPFGMDHFDFLGWMYEGGGWELYNDLYQKEMKLNVVPFPILPSSPQAFGWFKRPIKSLADFKTMKCRQTGIVNEIFQRMGMTTVNLPGGEIIPAAQRGVIDCAEWVGGVEDLRAGFHNVWKYHYVPGMHEPSVIGELLINGDVYKSFTPQQQEWVRSAVHDTFLRWWVKWQRQNADALKEMQEKHGVKVLRTPPEILTAFLKAWDEMAKEEAEKNAFFKKVWESQRAWASVVVPAKRFMNPPYSFAANHYWPEQPAKAAAKAAANK
jgi:TRAP-type mannitol/chloroaromatic compound transport system substrate-binding protein